MMMKSVKNNVKLKDRPGFETLGMRNLYRALYPFFHCKCEFPEEITCSDEPTVFIANHYSVFGPISFILSVPFVHCAWMNEDLVTPEKTEGAVYQGVKEVFPYLKPRFIRKICSFLSGHVCSVMLHFGCIPIDRNDAGKLIGTLRKSVQTLQDGNNILIFPEKGDPGFSLTSVTEFYEGFATLGAYYQRKNGKRLRFCPVYIDEQHHIIRSGEPEYYDCTERNMREENERISHALHDRIAEMAACSHGEEKEQRTPKRIGLMHLCNVLRILMLIPLLIVMHSPSGTVTLALYLLSHVLLAGFSTAVGTVPATNHSSCMISHFISILTDLCVLIHFRANRWHDFLTVGLILNGLVFLIMNIYVYLKERKCAGTSYFDSVSVSMIGFVNLLLITNVRLTRAMLHTVLLFSTIFLTLSTVSGVMFNRRLL